jgi:hypothetical protein
METKLEQPANAHAAIWVTEAGIIMLLNDMHDRKAATPIDFSPSWS